MMQRIHIHHGLRLSVSLCLWLLMVSAYSQSTINSVVIASKTLTHFMQNSHYQPIGACFWLKCDYPTCKIKTTLELDEYLPDLVVTVANQSRDNPWFIARQFDRLGFALGNRGIKAATGFHLSNGNVKSRTQSTGYALMRTKSVDVVGNPFLLVKLPFPSLTPDVQAFEPFYQSDMDVLGRLGVAESLRPETILLSHPIGQSLANHWSYEFPRNMTVNVANNYKASVVAALHAADIVTNKNALHTVHAATNTCGHNCVAANVIEEPPGTIEHVIWQEVYPEDKTMVPGENDANHLKSLGITDDNAGDGNYVFVLWRHYRGCVQEDGAVYLWAFQSIPPTVKR